MRFTAATLGEAYDRLGNAAARLARKAEGPDRITRYQEARQGYQEARALFAALRDQGALMPTNAGQIEAFEAKIAATDQALAEASH
ncbi:MAG: hypothetical protein M3Y80_05085 [Verrucomicrobiota bacterium]|nr:hypothetical protein [Verrucomicrobiota bacterium]